MTRSSSIPSAHSSHSKGTGTTPQTNKSKKPPKNGSIVDVQPAQFNCGQRVEFHDIKGKKHFGTVRWTGRKTRTKNFDNCVTGIETVSCIVKLTDFHIITVHILQDERVFIINFENALIGMTYLLVREVPNRHILFLPELFVEATPSKEKAQSHHAKQPRGVVHDQGRMLEEADKTKIAQEDEAGLKEMEAAEQSVNIIAQQEAYRKYETEQRNKAAADQADLQHVAGTTHRQGNAAIDHGISL